MSELSLPRLKEVSSVKNPLIKEVISFIESSKARRASERFIVEGLRELSRALESGWILETILYDPSRTSINELTKLIKEAQQKCSQKKSLSSLENRRDLLFVNCTSAVFDRIAYRSSVSNAVGIFRSALHSLSTLTEDNLHSPPLYLVAEGIEKPGNLGALLRTANAMGVSAVFSCNSHLNIYHPNVLRNSLGGFFDLSIVTCSTQEAIEWFKARQIQIVTTYLEGATQLESLDFTQATALVVGAEDQGVSNPWIEASDALAFIPMQGVVDSLNVSVATGMALFEITRQRRKHL